jgi:hypothetical protein
LNPRPASCNSVCHEEQLDMTKKTCAVAAVVMGLFAGAPVMAHHSFAAEFDIAKPLTLKGVVTKVEWINPHVYLHVDAKDDRGTVIPWSIETIGPARMHDAGMTKATFGIGKPVTMRVYQARDGSKNLAFLRTITFEDGHTVEVWLGDPNSAP